LIPALDDEVCMKSPQFSVSPEAAAFIRHHWQRPEVPKKAVVMQQELDVDPSPVTGEVSITELVEHGKRYLGSTGGAKRTRWAIGAVHVERVPKSEIVAVDGLLFAMNEELLQIVGRRKLVLDDGALRFEPDLQSNDRTHAE
jgi:hypothetical protein